MSRKYEITPKMESTIIQMYNKGCLDIEISRTLNIPSSSIYFYRKKHNMPSNYGKRADKNKEKIFNLMRMGCSMAQISERTGIGKSALREFFRRNGLLDLRKYRRKKVYKLGKREKSIFCGILLGDGTLYKNPNGKSVRFAVRHGPKQKGYSEYIYYQFQHLPATIKGIKIKPNCIDGKYIKGQLQSEVRINGLDFFQSMLDSFYKNGKKIIPLDFISEYYNAEALAFHFMDDGSKSCDSNGKINAFLLSTNAFSEEEISKFSLFLLGRFGLYSTVIKTSSGPLLRIKSNSVQRFINIVKPYIIDSLTYKISSSKTPLNREHDGKSCAKPHSNMGKCQTTNSDA